MAPGLNTGEKFFHGFLLLSSLGLLAEGILRAYQLAVVVDDPLRSHRLTALCGAMLMAPAMLYMLFAIRPGREGPGGGYTVLPGDREGLSLDAPPSNLLMDVWLVGLGLSVVAEFQQGGKTSRMIGLIGFIFCLLVVVPAFALNVMCGIPKRTASDVPRGAAFTPSSWYAMVEARSAPLLFKVFVPQFIAMVLYLLALTRRPGRIEDDGWALAYAIIGTLFMPYVFFYGSGFFHTWADLEFLEALMVLTRDNLSVVLWRGDEDVTLPRKRLRRLRTGYMATALVNVAFMFTVVLTLPLFLARSNSPMEFILNAYATVIVIQLDDVPNDKKITYTIGHATALRQRRISSFDGFDPDSGLRHINLTSRRPKRGVIKTCWDH